ncbi:hypothetical protein SAMN05216203_0459 [Marinobacter daqiaonensis]|uniref:Amine oxidase domain-containing protein n=2 Tax=Marinobacter daqiaonensis TaxID=650891 RepID=A0A1I6GTC2_9GAMM|nr:hypothetical protein SAMN05216203_0459 [Marinobacter daqiaonensis]
MAAKRLPEIAGSASSADIGAQYFTIRNPAFRSFLDQYAGRESYGEWSGIFRFQGADNVWQQLRPAERFVGIPRMTAITRALSTSLEIKAGIRIQSLDQGTGGLWRLTDTDGGVHDGFDAVLLTPPPAQTEELLKASRLDSLANDLNIRISRLQACWTVVVRFPTGTGTDISGYMPNSRLLHWAGNNSSKPGREDEGEWWVLHGDPDWSDANTETDPEEVRRQLLDEFLSISGITAEPSETLLHRWLYARPRARTGPGHLWFDDHRIGIMGDWLEGGRVEGAFNSADGLVRRLESLGLVPAPQPDAEVQS